MALLKRIIFNPEAEADLKKIDSSTLQLIEKRVARLAAHPEGGKPLSESLARWYSVDAVKRRYRIVYYIDLETDTVHVAAVGARQNGHRSDPYAKARRRR